MKDSHQVSVNDMLNSDGLPTRWGSARIVAQYVSKHYHQPSHHITRSGSSYVITRHNNTPIFHILIHPLHDRMHRHTALPHELLPSVFPNIYISSHPPISIHLTTHCHTSSHSLLQPPQDPRTPGPRLHAWISRRHTECAPSCQRTSDTSLSLGTITSTDRILPFGLATAGGIQGTIADAVIDILGGFGFKPTIRWVDDIICFREPSGPPSSQPYEDVPLQQGTPHPFSYAYNLLNITERSDPLGIPWHPVDIKGQDFAFSIE
jgi:hypothetical protein